MAFFKQTNLLASVLLLYSLPNFVNAENINPIENQTMLCMGCHGTKGNSTNPQYPSLAGQKAAYLAAQLNAFKSGLRNSPIMQNVAIKLSTEDIKDIANYFSSISTVSAGGDSTLAKAGMDKFSMCAGCHGAEGQGRGQFPKLASQQPAYLIKQLLNFKNRTRKSGPMNAIAASLTEQDIKEIAAYLGTL